MSSQLLTLGLGTFGNVKYLPTLGLGTGAVVIPPSTPTPTPGGGGGKRYNVGNLDLETWRKKHKKLKVRIEQVQEEIQAKREQIAKGPDYERIKVLLKRISVLQELLLKLLAQLDEARKMQDLAEEEEVLAIYMAYRTLH